MEEAEGERETIAEDRRETEAAAGLGVAAEVELLVFLPRLSSYT
jgi:hypothetical protein